MSTTRKPLQLLREALAFLVGWIGGMAVNMGLIMLNMTLHPQPNLDMNDPDSMQQMIDNMPFTGFLIVVLAHLGQAVVGGWIAARWSAARPVTLALLVGVMTAAGSLHMLLTYESPWWMWVEVPLALGLAWQIGRQEALRRERHPPRHDTSTPSTLR